MTSTLTRRSSFAFLLLCLTTLLTLVNSCGKTETPEKPTTAGTTPVTAPVPYPSVRGQEFKGEKNFAYLINNFQQGKTEPTPWAGFWWPYTKNGIASPTTGGASPAGKYDAARGGKTHAQAWEV